MDNTSTVRSLIDTLMDSKLLKMWTIYQEPSGSVLVKMRFMDTQQQQLDTKIQNSNIHFRRKSDKQINRDKARSELHSQNKRHRMATRSMDTDDVNE